MNNNILLDFFKEFIQRLGTKSPMFFRVISYVSAACALVTGIPKLCEELGINLPAWAEIAQSKTISIAAAVSFVISKLTTQSTPVGVSREGDMLKKTNVEKLPFTAKSEEKAAFKEGGVLNGETAMSKETFQKIDK